MPKKLFCNLPKEKQARITQAALIEFTEKTYNESSTNRIVKKAGISKGSLFKYFHTKEDLFFYVLDSVLGNFISELSGEVANLSDDLLERVVQYAEIEFSWYLRNPAQYKLIQKAFFDESSEIFSKIEKRYELVGDRFYDRLFQEIRFDHLQWDKSKILDILKWLLKGFNEEFINKTVRDDNEINYLKELYLRELQDYMTILQAGLYR